MAELRDRIDLVTARHATAADLEATTAFVELAKAEASDKRGGRWLIDHDLPRAPAREQHEQALADAAQCLVVGVIEGAVVGHARAYVSHGENAQLCMIEELFVHPEARSVGVGSAVLEIVRKWAVANGCDALESHVLPGNRDAKNFFERVGMKTRKMRVSAEL